MRLIYVNLFNTVCHAHTQYNELEANLGTVFSGLSSSTSPESKIRPSLKGLTSDLVLDSVVPRKPFYILLAFV